MLKTKIKPILIYILLIIVSATPLLYYTASNVSISGDYLFHLSRIENIFNNLKNGIVLPTIDQNNMNGLGYLIDIFYPNIFFYLPAIFRFFLPISIALQISVIIYNFIFGLIYIKIITKLFDKNKAICFTFLYLSSYYLFVDLVSRQAISEYFSALILPLVLLGTIDLIKNNKWKLLYISMTLVVYTHLLSLVAYTALIVAILIFNYKEIIKNKQIIKNLFKAGICSFITGLAFIIPFLYYFTKEEYFLHTTKNSILTINTPLDLLYVLIFIVITIAMFIEYNYFSKKINKYFLLSINGFIFFIYMYSTLCNWEVLSFFKLFQYKIRIGLFTNISLIIILSYILSKRKYIIKLFFITFCALSFETMLGEIFNETTNKEFEAVEIINKCVFNMDKDAKFDEQYCQIVFAEYLPSNLKIEDKLFIESCHEKSILENSEYLMNIEFEDLEKYKEKNKYIITTDKQEIVIDKVYYPTYRVSQENNKEINIENYNGFIKISNIKDGEIILKYGPTPLQYVSFLISISTIFIIIILDKKKIL